MLKAKISTDVLCYRETNRERQAKQKKNRKKEIKNNKKVAIKLIFLLAKNFTDDETKISVLCL